MPVGTGRNTAQRTTLPIGAAAISDAVSPTSTYRSRRTAWTWVRLGAGVLVLVLVAAKVGAEPFLDGLRRTSLGPVAVAVAVTALATVCCALRWRLVASALGVRLSPGTAVAAVYRAQLLNATLPGGVLGDVDRAVGHGRINGAVSATVRSVVWERSLGQVVQLVLTVAVVLAIPSPMRPWGLAIAAVAVIALGVLLLVSRTGSARVLRAAGDDLRSIVGTRRARIGIVLASAAAAAGHVAVFLVAARTAGVSATTGTMLPLAALVLLASAVPTNVAGWGPREGVAGWAFGVAGLGVGAGVTIAVVYGVMALVATLPGALVLLAGRRTWSRPAVGTPGAVLQEVARG